MEEKKITEQESLELISQMIQVTKQHIVKGSGNQFLIYGYMAAVLSVAIYILLYMTHNYWWPMGWFLMFLPAIIMAFKGKRNNPVVVTYTYSVIRKVWQVIMVLFYLTVFVMFVVGILLGKCNFVLMLPLSLLYASIGVAMTGVIIKESCLIYTPFVGFLFAIYMLMVYALNNSVEMIWQLYFGLSFVIMMIIPGHILNNKFKGQC